MVTEDGLKTCPRCEQLKLAASDFYRINARYGDGFSGYCKRCLKDKAVEWQKANPEKKAASDKRQNEKPDRKLKHLARGRKRYAADPKRANKRVVEWQRANHDRAEATRKKWLAANPETAKAHQRKHYWKPERRKRVLDHARLSRAFYKDQEMNGPGGQKLNRATWLAILDAFGNACCYCDAAERMTIEHLTPLRRGGRNEIGNIAPACLTCNVRKKTKSLEEFAPDRAVEIRRKAILCVEALAA